MSIEDKIQRAEERALQADKRAVELRRAKRRRELQERRKEAERRRKEENRRLLLKGRIYEQWEEKDPQFTTRMLKAAERFCIEAFDRAVFSLTPLSPDNYEQASQREKAHRERVVLQPPTCPPTPMNPKPE